MVQNYKNFSVVKVPQDRNIMGTSTNILFLSFAISLLAIAKSIEYQPISITVNENFNTQPSETQQGTLSLIPNSVHQGANFYFNPQVKLPSRLFPPHIFALLTSSHKKNESIMVQKEPGVFLSGEQIIEILRPNELNPTIDRGDIEEIALPIEELVLEEELHVQTPPETSIQEVVAIPDASMLPPTPSVIAEQVNDIPVPSPIGNGHAIVEEIVGIPADPVPPPSIAFEVVAIPDASMLPPTPSVIAEQVNDIPVPSPIGNGHAIVEEIVGIPADPVPPPSIAFIPTIIVEDDTGYVNNNLVSSPSPPSYNENEIISHDIMALPAAPLLPPLLINLHPIVIEEEINTLPIPKPVEVITEEKFETPAMHSPVHDKPETVIQQLASIPDAPILPPTSVNFSSPITTEEIHEKPILDPIILPADLSVSKPIEVIAEENFEIPVIPISTQIKPEIVTQELVTIPEAPILPPISINCPTSITEGINREPILESVVIPAEPSIYRPAEIVSEENIEFPPMTLPIHKPETVIEGLVAIPEAPFLSPLTINIPPSIITEEINREPILESVDIPAELHISRPAEIIAEENIGIASIPLPIHKPEAVIQDVVAIPEAPVLPPLSINFTPSIITNEIIQESVLDAVLKPAELSSSKPTEVVAGENIEICPEPLPIHDKPEAINQELLTIPEAPVLPSISSNFPPSISIEEINQEPIYESIVILENSTISKPAEVITEGTFEIPSIPLPTYTKPEVIQELVVLPEAPMLPPLSVQYLPSDIEVNEILKPKPIDVPVELSPKPAVIQGLFPIPDGPILPPFDFHRPVITEEINKIPTPEPLGFLAVVPTSKPANAVIEENGINSLPIPEIFNPIKLPAKFPMLKPIEVTTEENVDRLAIPIPTNGEHFVVQELVGVPKAPKLPASSIDGTPTVIKEDVKLEISSRPKQHIVQNFMIEGILKPRPYSNNIAVIKKYINPTVTSNLFNLRVAPSFQLHKTKPMAAQVIKNHVPNINQTSKVPISKLNMTLQSKNGKENRLVFSTSCARSIVADRIVPYMRRRGQPPKLFKIVSSQTVPNFPV